MNTVSRFFLIGATSVWPFAAANAASAAGTPPDRAQVAAVATEPAPKAHTVLASDAAAPKAEVSKQIRTRRLDRPSVEMETVTFLGVETAPVSPTLIAQLNLPDRAGVVVTHVVPDSPAAAALKPHDILLRFDDQILIDQHQLSVLIRNRKEGEEVNLTYLRAGKQANARVKLTKQEIVKTSDVLELSPFPIPRGATSIRRSSIANDERARAEAQRVVSLMKQSQSSGENHAEIRIENGSGPVTRTVTINTGNSNLVFSDDEGSLELVSKDGRKTLVAKNAEGVQLYSGPVTTPKEREAMPADIRHRLEKLEAMQDVTFEPKGRIERIETRVLHSGGPS